MAVFYVVTGAEQATGADSDIIPACLASLQGVC
jgi:hypothetical protein